jgi:hypothetical protein
VRAFIATRQAETSIVRRAYTVKQKDGSIRRVPEKRRTIAGVSNAEINRELTLLKRIFNLAIQANKILHKPYIPLLREDNTRTGFFELEQFVSVRDHLPTSLRPVVEFAYISGWRIASEVLLWLLRTRYTLRRLRLRAFSDSLTSCRLSSFRCSTRSDLSSGRAPRCTWKSSRSDTSWPSSIDRGARVFA